MEVDWVRAYKKVEETTTKYTGPMITVTEDAVETRVENGVLISVLTGQGLQVHQNLQTKQ